MNEVTIRELYWELNDEELRESSKLWDGAKDIEIVPRKIVEMIIEKCKKNEEALRPYYGFDFEDGADSAYTDIRTYTESLLKQFEGD